jgi:hypothetical protein
MFFLTRPLTLCLALTGGLVGTLAISSEASAENALILMKSVHVDPNTEEWTSVRRVFVRDPGYSSCLYLEETPHSCNLEQIRPDLLAAKLQVSQASPPVVHVEIMRDNTLIEKSELAPTKTSDDIYEYQSADGFTVTFGVKINTDAALRNPIRLDKLESLPGAFLTAKTTP